jgi:hypothetical protein
MMGRRAVKVFGRWLVTWLCGIMLPDQHFGLDLDLWCSSLPLCQEISGMQNFSCILPESCSMCCIF